jgi:hypothetical protein
MSKNPYTVGYGKPPLGSRFKPGRSGNAKGRPKGRKNFDTMLQEILNEPVTIREGDTVRRVPRMEAVSRAFILSAMKGNPKAYTTLVDIARQYSEAPPSDGPRFRVIFPDHDEVLELHRLSQANKLQEKKNPDPKGRK